jgi:hypothetical protein
MIDKIIWLIKENGKKEKKSRGEINKAIALAIAIAGGGKNKNIKEKFLERQLVVALPSWVFPSRRAHP